MGKAPQDVVAAGYDAIIERFTAWQSQIIGDPRERYVQKLLSLGDSAFSRKTSKAPLSPAV